MVLDSISCGATLNSRMNSSSLTSAVPDARRLELSAKLSTALQVHGANLVPPSFNHVLLVDDFYGSGTSLMDFEPGAGGERVMKGKFKRFLDNAQEWTATTAGATPFLTRDFTGTILLYMASAAASDHINLALEEAGLADRWKLTVVRVRRRTEVTDPLLLDDCDAFWDPVLEDDHKKCSAEGIETAHYLSSSTTILQTTAFLLCGRIVLAGVGTTLIA